MGDSCGAIASVLWRLLSTVGDSFSTVWDNISTCRGITSVLWGIISVLWRDTFSTVGELTAVHVGDSFSTVEGIQYIGGHQYMPGDNNSKVEDNISTVDGIQYSGRKF